MNAIRKQWRYVGAAIFLALTCVESTSAQFIVGVGTHFGQSRGNPDKILPMIRDLSATSIRDDIAWPLVEKKRGALEIGGDLRKITIAITKAKALGIEPLLVLVYGNKFYGGGYPVTPEAQDGFAKYSAYIAGEMRGKVRYFEIWNEWNAGGGVGNKATRTSAANFYLDLLKKVYPAIKAANSEAVVIGGAVEGAGPTAWIEHLFEEGGANYMDALSIHPYMHHKGKQGTPERLLTWLTNLTKRTAPLLGGKDLPIYITELGWPSSGGGKGVSESELADYVARTYLLVRTVPQIKGMWWYNFQNNGDHPKREYDNFGLVDTKLSPKAAYFALADIAPAVSSAPGAERLFENSGVWVVQLTNANGGKAIFIWDANGKSGRIQLNVRAPKAQTIIVSRTGANRAQREEMSINGGSSMLTFEVNGSPLLIDSNGQPLDALGVTAAQ